MTATTTAAPLDAVPVPLDAVPALLGAVHALLAAAPLAGAGTLPRRLRELEAALAADLPGLRLHLVTHREPYDGSTSYDVLVRGLGPAVSLGVAGSPDLPWPLRGAVRADDRRLLRVDGQYLGVDEAMTVVDDVFAEPASLRLLLRAAVVRGLVAEHGVEVTDAQVQDVADAFRRAHGLRSAADTDAWLRARGLSREAFTDQMVGLAEVALLRRTLTIDRVGALLADAGRYDVLTVAWTADPGPAPGPDDALPAVLAAHAAGRDGAVLRSRAGRLDAGLRPLLGTTPGTTIPVEVDGAPAHAVVLARHAAVLDEGTRALAEKDAFDELVDAVLDRSDVEWFWGETGRTRLVRG